MAKKKKTMNVMTFAKGALRRASLMFPSISEARRLARKERGLYQCALCKELHKAKDVQVDHRSPVVDMEKGFTTLDEFALRLFCPVEELDVLCNNCHDAKTASEVQMRKYFRAKRKAANLETKSEEDDEI